MSEDVGRRPSTVAETASANRAWWDQEAADYYVEHGAFLGDADFVWGPEGWTEAELDILGIRPEHRVLEIGGGAGQCARWLRRTVGCTVVSTDLSIGMLRTGAAIDVGVTPAHRVPLAQCDALALPFGEGAFDRVFTAYGAVPFVADSATLVREAARVLRPGGVFAYSTSHPIRWAFPDDPSDGGLTVRQSYFDPTPYVEMDGSGRATYVEHHRTLEQRVRDLVDAGLSVTSLRELPWPERNSTVWGGWSPQRGRLIPGTLLVSAAKR